MDEKVKFINAPSIQIGALGGCVLHSDPLHKFWMLNVFADTHPLHEFWMLNIFADTHIPPVFIAGKK
jgi:hypothetical protein